MIADQADAITCLMASSSAFVIFDLPESLRRIVEGVPAEETGELRLAARVEGVAEAAESMPDTKANIKNKVSRGGFPAVFVIQYRGDHRVPDAGFAA